MAVRGPKTNAKIYISATEPVEMGLKHLLKANVLTYASCDTTQVKDYSQYSMAMFDAQHKKDIHDTQFPSDLKSAFEMGKKLAQ